MRRRQLLFLSFLWALLSVAWTLPAQSPPDVTAARQLADLDLEFSKSASSIGMPAASLRYFADDGIAFAPNAVNARKYWADRTDFAGVLVWQPIFALASRAADLGYTTGPWELKKKSESASIAFGNYVSVWSKQPEGEWKVALDVGTESPQPSGPPSDLQLLAPELDAGERALAEAQQLLQKRERSFLEAARADLAKAIIAFANDDIHVYRDNAAPAVGLAAARIMLASDHFKVMRTFGGTKLSSSGDLSYTYGNYSEERGNVTRKGIYLMIWRINLNGEWKLMLDLQKKIPDKE